ncbi:hypothetical protein M758_8G094600 [Ceratodon purpureus]|nr:hypothetical protein M758_8G094600 [Ceratodon purpureus]
MLEIRGLHLYEADLIAQTHDQSMRLSSESKESRDSEELEALRVQCPPDDLHQDLFVYASKTIAVEGSLISVQCEPVKVVSSTDNLSTTDSTTWIIATLVMSVPVTQVALTLLYPSSESPLAITVGQGLGWMMGWLTQKLLAARNPNNQGKALKPADKKEEKFRRLSETGENQDAVRSKLTVEKEEQLRTLSRTGDNQDFVPLKVVPSKPAVEKKNFSKHFRRGGWVILFVLLTLLSHWLWTHMGAFEKKWLLVGTTTTTICIIIFKLQAKLRKTRDKDISPSRYWTNVMSTAITYNEWTHAASMLHSHSDSNEAKLYDEAYVQGKLRELQTRRMEGTTQEILFFLRADLIRHLGNMCNPQLHKCRNEVPAVIRDYINEVRYHLQAVCEMDVDEFTLEEKLTFLTETRQRFGRTALVFSGHVALGTFHSSVFRTLVEHQLLPSVIVGANLGAIVASFATTRTASELRHFFDDPSLPIDFYEKLSTVYVAAYRLRTQEARPYEIEKLQQSMQDLLGDLTFEEAFDLSGRILGISIPACPIDHQPAQFLNYLASPHVVIWSAVAVSCVAPSGLLHRPELMIKDRYNRIVPYIPPTKMTSQKAGSETSLETEIPFRQVEELFNVNHFIISQASPYIASWLHFKESTQERSPLAAKFVNMMEMEVRHRCAQLSDMGIKLRGLTSLCAQKWEGDINITLPVAFSQAISISTTQNDDPSPNELRKAAMAGRRCTWAKLSAIHASCGIELMLDEYINELHRRERHAQHREEDYHRLNDLNSIKGTRQSELDIGRLTRATVNTAQSSQGDYTSNANDELEHSTPGHCTPSEAGTEDYLLDHLCSCTSNKPESRMRCDMTPAVSDQGVHLVEEDCDTMDDNHGAVGDITWSGESHLPDELTIEDHLQQPTEGEHVVESVCEQYKLHNREIQLERDIGCEDADSYGSPTTVLEGPSARSRIQLRKVVDRITHPGCNLERYFEEMSNSSYHLDERDDDI